MGSSQAGAAGAWEASLHVPMTLSRDTITCGVEGDKRGRVTVATRICRPVLSLSKRDLQSNNVALMDHQRARRKQEDSDTRLLATWHHLAALLHRPCPTLH